MVTSSRMLFTEVGGIAKRLTRAYSRDSGMPLILTPKR